ncbi:carboxylesterase family protein [Kutzneria viridogrisea]|uniref:Carboxylic ester hydrolase n=1 Tax=Kutzneria viridogrisea TaxID=47990 RepID=A0ABR6BDD2_9PSEU|nr:para-nitrobenzyl esterase [Kutzneria viridogrisea]
MPHLISTPHGQVRGVEFDGVRAWRGIPYAQPPTGPLRHRAPRPVTPWSGVREATEFAARAPQPPPLFRVVPPRRPAHSDDPDLTSEDCLYLNVCAPARPASAPRPVLVWLHGGGYSTGSGPEGIGDGETLVREHDLVAVTVNYRLGAFGFLNLGGESANCGVLDQIAALGWVRDSIGAFGGDPAQVTVAGVSAGAKAVATLLAAPLASGLFTRAVSISGGGDHVATQQVSAEWADRFCALLGIGPERVGEVPAAELVAAQQQLSSLPTGLWRWRPTVDGVVLPDLPARRIAAGSAPGVALLAGTTSHEANTFQVLDPRCADRAPAVLTEAFGADRAQRLLAVYEGDLLGVMTDERYGVPTVRLLDGQSAHAPAWRYRFDGAAPWLPAGMAAGHGTDVPFHWAVGGLHHPDPDTAGLLRAASEQFGRFVRTGRCDWARYEPSRRATRVLDAKPHVAEDPGAPRRAAWDGLTWPSGTWYR